MRRHYNLTAQQPIASAEPLVHVVPVNGVLMNVITPGYTGSYGNAVDNFGYVYYNDATTPRMGVYINNDATWNGIAPKPGVNGVTPAYLGLDGMRLEMRFKIDNFNSDPGNYTYDGGSMSGSLIFCNASSNNTMYRGIGLIYNKSNGRWLYGGRWNSYNMIAQGTETIANYRIDTSTILKIIFDFRTRESKLTLYDETNSIKILESGILVHPTLTGSARQVVLMVGNWDSTRHTYNILEYKLWNSIDCENFML